jgi:hypothetical protein
MSLFPRPPEEPPRKVSSDPLKQFVAAQFWHQWPSNWDHYQSGVFAQRGREGLGHVVNNLAKMRKRLEEMGKARIKMGDRVVKLRGL